MKVGDILKTKKEQFSNGDGEEKLFEVTEINSDGTLCVKSLCEDDLFYQTQLAFDGYDVWVNRANPDWFDLIS